MDINSIWNQMLGRNMTPEENEYISQQLHQGALSPLDIYSIAGSHPEAVQRRTQGQMDQMGNMLSANDSKILGLAGNEAQARMATLGRNDTSAIGAQIAQAGQNLAMDRNSALANFYGKSTDYLNNSYLQGEQNANTRQNAYTQHLWDIDMFDRHKNAYNDYLNQQNKGWLGKALFQVGGNAAAAYLGGLGGRAGGTSAPRG